MITKDLPDWSKDALYLHIDIKLSLVDRLLVLIGMPFKIRTKTVTENKLGRCETEAVELSIQRPIIKRRVMQSGEWTPSQTDPLEDIRKTRESFVECPDCESKPGCPILCPECLERRAKYYAGTDSESNT